MNPQVLALILFIEYFAYASAQAPPNATTPFNSLAPPQKIPALSEVAQIGVTCSLFGSLISLSVQIRQMMSDYRAAKMGEGLSMNESSSTRRLFWAALKDDSLLLAVAVLCFTLMDLLASITSFPLYAPTLLNNHRLCVAQGFFRQTIDWIQIFYGFTLTEIILMRSRCEARRNISINNASGHDSIKEGHDPSWYRNFWAMTTLLYILAAVILACIFLFHPGYRIAYKDLWCWFDSKEPVAPWLGLYGEFMILLLYLLFRVLYYERMLYNAPYIDYWALMYIIAFVASWAFGFLHRVFAILFPHFIPVFWLWLHTITITSRGVFNFLVVFILYMRGAEHQLPQRSLVVTDSTSLLQHVVEH